MPIDIRAIRERRKTFTVEFDGGVSLSLDYYPAKASRLGREAIQELAAQHAGESEREQRHAIAALLCDVLYGWDVTTEGEPFPLDPDALADEFDDAFLGFCLGAVVSDAQQSKSNGELLRLLGTVTTSPKADGNNSPATKVEGSHPKRSSSKSRRKAASAPGS